MGWIVTRRVWRRIERSLRSRRVWPRAPRGSRSLTAPQLSASTQGRLVAEAIAPSSVSSAVFSSRSAATCSGVTAALRRIQTGRRAQRPGDRPPVGRRKRIGNHARAHAKEPFGPARSDPGALRRVADPAVAARQHLQRDDALSRRRLPKAHGAVHRARREPATVRRERDRAGRAAVAEEDAAGPARASCAPRTCGRRCGDRSARDARASRSPRPTAPGRPR